MFVPRHKIDIDTPSRRDPSPRRDSAKNPLESSYVDDDYRVVYFEHVICTYSTDKAILCREPVDGKESWIPRKAVHDDYTEVREIGDEGVLAIHLWFGEMGGFI